MEESGERDTDISVTGSGRRPDGGDAAGMVGREWEEGQRTLAHRVDR